MVSKTKTPTNINNEKRKISFDIIELLDDKVNKYVVILGILILYSVLYFLYIQGRCLVDVCSVRLTPYVYVLSHPFFILYLTYLLTKHVFTKKNIDFIIHFIKRAFDVNVIYALTTVIISFIVSIFLLNVSNNVVKNLSLVIDYHNEKPEIDITQYVKPRDASQNESHLMKPLIYLYPEADGKVVVELGKPEKISHSYPKYENKWEVIAKTNSGLIYNNRNYYGLYWEGIDAPKINLDEGFVVKGSDTISFLEEKLAMLGLNEREANEFIIYWLPKLENNPYNFITFASMQLQNEYMPLEITPKPDTLIRVLMAYKKLDNPIKVKEQVLSPTPIRDGFVAVEWGGTEIDSGLVY